MIPNISYTFGSNSFCRSTWVDFKYQLNVLLVISRYKCL